MTSRREMLANDASPRGDADAPRSEDEALVKLTGTMKWFDATRGFGFLVSEQAKGDVLVHFSVLKEHDRRSLPEGAIVECLVAQQERGRHGVEPAERQVGRQRRGALVTQHPRHRLPLAGAGVAAHGLADQPRLLQQGRSPSV